MTTDNFCFYLQNKLIQSSQTGGPWYSGTPPLVFPGYCSLENQFFNRPLEFVLKLTLA